MSDWESIKQRARRITRKIRAVVPANGERMNDDMLHPFRDRLPRPSDGQAKAAPRIKQGREISGTQMAALKAGTMNIDARLDLHGRTQHDAFRELNHFMKKHTARGARLLLVITGKGKNNEGVLRMSLPGWLMEGEYRHHVLTIHPAHHRHGGDGATYVLLRRPEGERVR